jgi:hypothetical protein
MKKLFCLLFVLLLITPAFAGDAAFIVGYDFSKDVPCATATSTLCVQDIIVYDTLTGVRRVDYTIVAPSTATTLTTITTPFVTLKGVYGPVVFAAVARARDGSGNLIESAPFFAPSATLMPSAVVSFGVK